MGNSHSNPFRLDSPRKLNSPKFQSCLTNQEFKISPHEIDSYYEMLFDSVNDALLVFQLDSDGLPGRFIDVNEMACRVSGYSRKALFRMSLFDILSFTSKEEMISICESLIDQGNWTDNRELITAPGEKRPMEIGLKLLDFGRTIAIMAHLRPISGTERSVEESSEIESVETIGQLAAGLAHDFSNVLSGIIGFSELALQQIGDQNPATDYLRTIIKKADTASSFSRRLMSLSELARKVRVVLDGEKRDAP